MKILFFLSLHILLLLNFLISPSICANDKNPIDSKVKDIELRLLLWEGYSPKKEVAFFTNKMNSKYKINLKMQIKYADEVEEFYDQIKAKQTDIISPAHNIAKSDKYRMIQKNLILPLELANIPNYKKLIPVLKNAEYATHNWQLYSVPIAHGPYGLAYNTKYFKTAPDSWDVLWDPKYKNQFSISLDQYEANVYITALALKMPKKHLFNIEYFRNQSFIKKLNNLSLNAKNKWVGVDTAKDLKGLKLATTWGDSLNQLKREGEEWKMAEPKEGTTGWVDNLLIGYSLKNKSLEKKIAEEWINFCIGDNFQTNVILREMGNDPVNLSIISKLSTEEIKKHHLDQPNYFRKNRILWPILNIKTQNGFKLMWQMSTVK